MAELFGRSPADLGLIFAAFYDLYPYRFRSTMIVLQVHPLKVTFLPSLAFLMSTWLPASTVALRLLLCQAVLCLYSSLLHVDRVSVVTVRDAGNPLIQHGPVLSKTISALMPFRKPVPLEGSAPCGWNIPLMSLDWKQVLLHHLRHNKSIISTMKTSSILKAAETCPAGKATPRGHLGSLPATDEAHAAARQHKSSSRRPPPWYGCRNINTPPIPSRFSRKEAVGALQVCLLNPTDAILCMRSGVMSFQSLPEYRLVPIPGWQNTEHCFLISAMDWPTPWLL